MAVSIGLFAVQKDRTYVPLAAIVLVLLSFHLAFGKIGWGLSSFRWSFLRKSVRSWITGY
jgi:hypothetical protein